MKIVLFGGGSHRYLGITRSILAAPGLMNDGGDAELVDIEGDTVLVRLQGRCASCPSATQTLKHWVEAKLHERVSTALLVKEVK